MGLFLNLSASIPANLWATLLKNFSFYNIDPWYIFVQNALIQKSFEIWKLEKKGKIFFFGSKERKTWAWNKSFPGHYLNQFQTKDWH